MIIVQNITFFRDYMQSIGLWRRTLTFYFIKKKRPPQLERNMLVMCNAELIIFQMHFNTFSCSAFVYMQNSEGGSCCRGNIEPLLTTKTDPDPF